MTVSRSLQISHSPVILPRGVMGMTLNIPQNEPRREFSSVMPIDRKISSFGKVAFRALKMSDYYQNKNNNHIYQ
jgi:hypothetical protein